MKLAVQYSDAASSHVIYAVSYECREFQAELFEGKISRIGFSVCQYEVISLSRSAGRRNCFMCANMEFDDVWDISRTHDYVVDNGYSRVTLQFPDDMLEDAPLVAGTLQQHLAQGGSAAQVSGCRPGTRAYLQV